MPCLNEAATLPVCIDKAKAFLARAGVSGEVLVSDNGSTDGSQAIAEAHGARVVHAPQRGYGAALMSGIAHSRGRYIVMGDADDSYDFSQLDNYLSRLRDGAQLVMGNRFRGGIAPGAMPFLHRYLGNPVLSFIGRLFFRVPIRDFHCGLRGFSREAVLKLGLVTPGMEFASEMVAKAALAGLRISEVPTTLQPDGRGRPPHLRTWRDGWRHLRFLLLFCPRWLFLYPGLVLALTGAVGMVLLNLGPVTLFGVGLGVHSQLYMAAATVLGAQLVQFAFLTKWLGVLSGIVPVPLWLTRTQAYLSVEAGLLASGGAFLVGLVWSVRLVLDWGLAGFGVLDPLDAMRSAIPAVTLMILGVQAAASVMFAGALHFCWQSTTGPRHG